MKREKITELKEFLYLIATEPENVYYFENHTQISSSDRIGVVKDNFSKDAYYYQPQEKKRVLALFCCRNSNVGVGEIKVFELINKRPYYCGGISEECKAYENMIFIQGSEFYEDGSEYKGDVK